MKRIVAILLFMLIMLSLCACKSPEEKRAEALNEGVRQAQAAADKAEQDYDELQQNISDYESAVERVESFD